MLNDAVTTLAEGFEAGGDPAILARLRATVHIREDMAAAVTRVVQEARSGGHTWEEIAHATGLASPQAAHWRFGANRADQLGLLRKRTSGRTAPPGPELPGITTTEAARRLGVDQRTVRARIERGELHGMQVTWGTRHIVRVTTPIPEPPKPPQR